MLLAFISGHIDQSDDLAPKTRIAGIDLKNETIAPPAVPIFQVWSVPSLNRSLTLVQAEPDAKAFLEANMLPIKVVLLAILLLTQAVQPASAAPQDVRTQLTDQNQRYSVLERTDLPSTKLKAPAPVARMAQLPDSLGKSSTTRSSRRQAGFAPKEPPQTHQATKSKNDLEREPRFQIEISGADLVSFGQLQVFRIKVKNQWPADSHPAQIQLGLPPGFELIDSDIRAQYDPSRHLALWQLKSVAADSEIEIKFRARGIGRGPQLFQVFVIHASQLQASTQLETIVNSPLNSNRQSLPTSAAATGLSDQQQALADRIPPILRADKATLHNAKSKANGIRQTIQNR